MINPLNPSVQASALRPEYRPAMAQVGWLGHAHGDVYALRDQPLDDREPGGFSPLYIQIGTWEDDDGKWVLRD